MKQTPVRIGRRTTRGVLAPAVALVLTTSLLAPASDPGEAGSPVRDLDGPAPVSAHNGASHEVTLITGDVVHWNVDAEGKGSAIVEDKGAQSSFQTIESDEGYYVIPSEVSPLVGSYLDRELFNVSGLVDQGFTDDAVEGVPVILQGGGADSMSRRTANAAPGLTVEQRLPSINSTAGTVNRNGAVAFGEELASAAESAQPVAQEGSTSRTAGVGGPTTGVDSLPGVDKIWLDQLLTVSLEDSVPQTGAPQAWEAGFDGTGMTIAVLDSGIDPDHPDVADKIAASQNFTGEDSIQDGHGHGTHVASTAAGTGAASDGLRKGVAPGADLVIGKVMDSNGDGYTSQIIAGMEWAAGLPDVDVINMSLGGSVSDGTDPMSLALNELTAEHGVLFVTSAGNDGPGSETVSYPATADAALTVGAVDKNSELAWFSSRGPRYGDGAIKPEITAPGVAIQAARAAGTSMGSPVNDFYTAANGTSMAAPHVAGAVAVLKQQHPDWDPATLKAALVNSATPHEDLSVFEQGGGELNLAQAVQTSVVSTPATLSMGSFEFPHEGADPVTKTVTYTNHGEGAAVINLQVELTDGEGNPAPAGMITVEPSSVDLAAGASVEVEVTIDRSLGVNGSFSGSVETVDSDGNRLAGTPIGFLKEEEVYELTIEGVQRNGEPASEESSVAVLDAVTMSDFGDSGVEFVDGVATVQVPPGTYSVIGMISTLGPEDGSDYESQAMMGDPQVEVTEDTHLTFDARDAVEITIDTPYNDVTVEGHAIQYQRTSSKSGNFVQAWVGGDFPYYVSATDPVTLGEFNFGSKFELSAPGVWMDLAYPEFGAIPADPSYTVNDETVATVDTAYHSDTTGQRYARAVPARLPWERAAFAEYRSFRAPLERIEHYSANETRFYQAVVANWPFGSTYYEAETGYQAGEQLQQSWFASPRTPSLDEGNEYTPSEYTTTRLGNTLNVAIFEFGDSNPGDNVHYGAMDPFGSDTAAFRLFQDGELYATGARAFGTVPVEPQSRLRFELDVARDAQWWTTSTQTHTAWEFDSATTESREALPLLQIDYDINLDLTNTAVHPKKAKGPFTIGLDVRQPFGVDSAEIEDIRAWVSYDDGQTWEQRTVKAASGGTFQFSTDNRDGGGAVSIKVEAHDADGNTVEQEVIRAYKLRP